MNDTSYCPDSGGAGGSRSQVLVGHAIVDACQKLIAAMTKDDGTYRTHDEMVAEGLDLRYEGSWTQTMAVLIDPEHRSGTPDPELDVQRLPRRGLRRSGDRQDPRRPPAHLHRRGRHQQPPERRRSDVGQPVAGHRPRAHRGLRRPEEAHQHACLRHPVPERRHRRPHGAVPRDAAAARAVRRLGLRRGAR